MDESASDIEVIGKMLSDGYCGLDFMSYEGSWLEVSVTKEQAQAMVRLFGKEKENES